jgi:hypothetical protein
LLHIVKPCDISANCDLGGVYLLEVVKAPLVVKARCRGAVEGSEAEAMEIEDEDVDGDKCTMVGGDSKSRCGGGGDDDLGELVLSVPARGEFWSSDGSSP